MEKLLGILPYIYFEEPVQLGDIKLVGIPDWQGKNHVPITDLEKRYLQELSSCFSTTRGLSTSKGGTRALTYFLLESGKGMETESLEKARKALTLLRYTMLRPDYQALDNLESTYLYAFALPPVSSDNYCIYQCWPNLNLEQEIWISPARTKFPLPDLSVDCKLIDISRLEDIQELRQKFYELGLSNQTEADTLLAMEWYNQSFQKYSMRSIPGHLVDLSIAFETLFQLQENKITLKNAIIAALDVTEESPISRWAGAFYKAVRSATMHSGKPASLLFKHSEAQTPHLSFLWSARRIFRECVAFKTGLPRNIPTDRLVEDFIPNEVYLDKLKKAGSFEKILANNMVGEIGKLRAIYPTGKREDIIWLGKELLRGYKELYKPSVQSLPTLESIMISGDVGTDLGLKYYRFLEEFRPIYPDSYIAVGWGEISKEAEKKLKVINKANIKQMQLESVIYSFASFAGWALLLPT